MCRIFAFFVFTAGLALAVGIVGCTSQSGSSTSSPPAGPSTTGNADHGDHTHGDHMEVDHASAQSPMDKMKAELAKLSPEDAASAEKQHMCPVSGEMLGTMGPPKKVEVNGQQVWICCEHCEEKLTANPNEYLAKLHKE